MGRENDPDNYAGRVNLAALIIGSGRETSRSFDNCFENYDGDAVAVALYRRAQKSPDTALARNLWRYLCRESVTACAEKNAHRTNLAAWARELRAKASAENAGFFAYLEDVRRFPTYHDGTPRKGWHELGDAERRSWIDNPTPRTLEGFSYQPVTYELTPIGEQAVIPGCERNLAPARKQLDLFG